MRISLLQTCAIHYLNFRNLRHRRGFPNSLNSTNRSSFWTEISLTSRALEADLRLHDGGITSKRKNQFVPKVCPNICKGPKKVGSIFTWKKFALKVRVNSLLALGMCPVCPCVRCPDPQRWIHFKTMGLASSSAVGQAAEALGKFSTLTRVNLSSFDSKKNRFEESEMVGTCWNGFLFCSVFFSFSQGFRISMFQFGNMESEDNFWVLKRRRVGQESNGFFLTESISRSPEYQIFRPTKIK